MRKILFRGKRTDNGEWVEGHYLQWPIRGWKNLSSVIVPTDDLHDGCAQQVEVLPDTVGQYTGLNDRNGDKIFEGDILRYGEKNLLVWWNDEAFQWQAKEQQSYDPIFTFDGTAGVVWDNIDFGWIAAEIPCTGKMTTEIIGNVYDNPELLK